MLRKCFSYFLPVKDKLHQVGGVHNFLLIAIFWNHVKLLLLDLRQKRKKEMMEIEETKKVEKEARKKIELQQIKLDLDDIE